MTKNPKFKFLKNSSENIMENIPLNLKSEFSVIKIEIKSLRNDFEWLFMAHEPYDENQRMVSDGILFSWINSNFESGHFKPIGELQN